MRQGKPLALFLSSLCWTWDVDFPKDSSVSSPLEIVSGKVFTRTVNEMLCLLLKLLLNVISFLLFCAGLGSNPGPPTCWASVLPESHTPASFLRLRSVLICVGAELACSLSYPSKPPGNLVPTLVPRGASYLLRENYVLAWQWGLSRSMLRAGPRWGWVEQGWLVWQV